MSPLFRIRQYQDAMEKEKLELERKLAENSCQDKSKPHCGPFMMRGLSSCPNVYDDYPNIRGFSIFSNCPLASFYMSKDHRLYLPRGHNFTKYIYGEQEMCSSGSSGINCIEIDLPNLRLHANVTDFAIPTMCGNINFKVTEDYQLIFPCSVGVTFDENNPKSCKLKVSEAQHPQDCNMESRLSDQLIAKLKKERKEEH